MKIKLENKFGNILRIKVNIWVPGQSIYAVAAAIFDTGAYKTIIDEELAKKLDMPIVQRNSLTVTAIGAVSTQSSTLPQMMFGTAILQNVPVNVMPLPEQLDARCIIGMNILQEYEIHINHIAKLVTLTQKPTPKKYFRPDYSVVMPIVESEGAIMNGDNETLTNVCQI